MSVSGVQIPVRICSHYILPYFSGSKLDVIRGC